MRGMVQDFRPTIQKHVQRLAHIDSIMQTKSPPLLRFHMMSQGVLDSMEKLIMNLAPHPFTGKPLPSGMLQALLRIQHNLPYCPWDHLYECMKRNLDITDNTLEIISHIHNALPEDNQSTQQLSENTNTANG